MTGSSSKSIISNDWTQSGHAHTSGAKLYRVLMTENVNDALALDDETRPSFLEWLKSEDFETSCALGGLDDVAMGKCFRVLLAKSDREEALEFGRKFRRMIMSTDSCEAELERNIVFGRKVPYQVKRSKKTA